MRQCNKKKKKKKKKKEKKEKICRRDFGLTGEKTTVLHSKVRRKKRERNTLRMESIIETNAHFTKL